MTSSGWQGLVTQSSAPSRRPRTRWATVEPPVQTTTPAPAARRTGARASPRPAARTAPDRRRARDRRIATSVSVGVGPLSTRCSQPSRSRRLPRTCRNPESVSMTATRRPLSAADVLSDHDGQQSRAPRRRPRTGRSQVDNPLRAGFSRARRRGARSPRTPGTARSRRTPSARRCRPRCRRSARARAPTSIMCIAHSRVSGSSPISTASWKISRLRRLISLVLAHQVLRPAPTSRSANARLACTTSRARAARPSAGARSSISSCDGRLVAGQRDQLGDVHALVAHALDVLDHVQQRGDEPQVAGHRRLQRQQRQDPLVDLQVAAVDAVVVGDDDRRELDVLVLERLERAVELARRRGRGRRAPAPRARRSSSLEVLARRRPASAELPGDVLLGARVVGRR